MRRQVPSVAIWTSVRFQPARAKRLAIGNGSQRLSLCWVAILRLAGFLALGSLFFCRLAFLASLLGCKCVIHAAKLRLELLHALCFCRRLSASHDIIVPVCKQICRFKQLCAIPG